MATVDQKGSDRDVTTTTSGTHLFTNVPIGGGKYTTKRIEFTSLFSATNAAISSIQNAVSTKTREANKSAAFTVVIPADSKLESIDLIWVSGAPSVKIGSTAGASDIISTRTPTSGDPKTTTITDYYDTAKTLYVTVTSGAIDFIINYKENYNS